MSRRISSKALRNLVQNPLKQMKDRLRIKVEKVEAEKTSTIALIQEKVKQLEEKISKVNQLEDVKQVTTEYQELSSWMDYMENALYCLRSQLELTNDDNFLVERLQKLGVDDDNRANLLKNGSAINGHSGVKNIDKYNGYSLDETDHKITRSCSSMEDNMDTGKKQKLLVDDDDDDLTDFAINGPPTIKCGVQTTVVACFIKSPTSFWLHYDPNQAMDVGHRLQIAQNNILRKGDWRLNSVKVGKFCAASYSQDGYYYRAKIVKVHQDASSIFRGEEGSLTMDVLYVDYGNIETRSFNDVMKLDPEFKKTAPLAVRCCLNCAPVETEWSENAIGKFKSVVCNNELFATFFSPLSCEESDVIYTVDLFAGKDKVENCFASLPRSEWADKISVP